MIRTMLDEQADALSEEFEPFSVWVDFRPLDDGQPHWHARRPGWSADQIIHAHDATGMRDKIIIWKRENES